MQLNSDVGRPTPLVACRRRSLAAHENPRLYRHIGPDDRCRRWRRWGRAAAELAVAGGESAEVFEAVEAAFDAIAELVERGTVGGRPPATAA